MIVTAWKNGRGSYGLRVSRRDREQSFRRGWSSVTLELEGWDAPVEVNVGKPSFWTPGCGELIKWEIRDWLMENNLVPWPYREPPKLVLEPLEGGRFLLRKPCA